MALNPQAIELNNIIQEDNPSVFNLLSKRGKAIFFPKKGILGQTAQATGCKINATIGSALEDDNTIMSLPSITSNIGLKPKDAIPYAKGPGKPALRTKWKEMMTAKSPSLEGASISLPMVTNALTHGLSMVGYMFLDQGDEIIVPDYYWGNYNLIFKNTWQAEFNTYTTFTPDGHFNCEGLKQKLNTKSAGKKIVLLNFPNNPTGYTLTIEEGKEIIKILTESANNGNDILVIIDDAYFGLVYEDGIMTESIFAKLSHSHERILAVKLDGPTKEDYVWGLRVGFVTFGIKNNSPKLYQAIESKLAGAIRGTISNTSHVGQSLMLAAYESETYAEEKAAKFKILKNRYHIIIDILKNNPNYSEIFTPQPCNSGYFLCVEINDAINIEELRQLLIKKYSTGLIATGSLIRIAFSSTPTNSLGDLFDNLYKAGKELLDE